jgi:hypothetical protein
MEHWSHYYFYELQPSLFEQYKIYRDITRKDYIACICLKSGILTLTYEDEVIYQYTFDNPNKQRFDDIDEKDKFITLIDNLLLNHINNQYEWK